MSTASLELQRAVFAVLRAADPAIAEGRIYDDTPEGTDDDDANFPYVEIGEGDVIPDGTQEGDSGFAETINIHVWSRYAGKREAKLIAGQIYDVLHEASLDVEGRASAHAFVRRTTVFTDPDGKTRHGVVTIEVIHRSYGD